MSNNDLWRAVLGELELIISKANFTTWFLSTSIYFIDEYEVVVSVPNIFAKEWLEKKYKKHILSALQKYRPKINNFSCRVGQVDLNVNKSSIKQKQQKSIDSIAPNTLLTKNNHSTNTSQIKDTLKNIPNKSLNTSHSTLKSGFQKTLSGSFVNNLNSRYRFDNFIVSSNNELASAACQSISKQPGENYNPLFVYGGVGLGKTHLLQATGNQILQNFPNFKVHYSSMERFSNELIDAIQKNKAKEFKNKYIALDILILDDIQFLSGKEKTQEEFFHVFESLYQLGKQVILSSDRPPKSISTLEDRLRSRFEGGMIVDVEKPDFETRLAIIDKKLEEKKFKLDRKISEYLAKNIYHNIRELEGALNKIIVTFQFQNRMPEMDDVINLTKDIISINHQKDTTPTTILEAIADYFNIDVKEIINRCRKKNVIKPRQIAFYLLRTELDMSYPEIGKFMGGRDHSTAIYAYEKIKKALPFSDDLTNQIKFIKEKISTC